MSDQLRWDDCLRAELKAVGDEFTALAHLDDVFWQVQAIMADNAGINHGGIFQTWLVRSYTDSIAIRLRRLGDRGKDNVSLWRLLERLKGEQGRLTRTWYKAMWPRELVHLANSRFDFLAGRGSRYVSGEILSAKQHDLDAALRAADDFANQQVAHRRKESSAFPVTFGDVRQCLVGAFRVFKWSALMLNAATWVSAVPRIQSDWLRVFHVAWLPEDRQPPEYRHLDSYFEQDEF